MSSLPIIGATTMVFIVAALLFYQSGAAEGFDNYYGKTWENWNVQKDTPLAGRLYDPAKADKDAYMVPADLKQAPIAQPYNGIPLSQQRPNATPGTGTSTAPLEAMAQIKDLGAYSDQIMLWLDAADQLERTNPGILTSDQLQRRVMLQSDRASISEQVGSGIITDTYKRIARETLALRRENEGWQRRGPSLDEVYEFGSTVNPTKVLSKEEYGRFFQLLNAAIDELQGLTQANPLQKVRLQQLQVQRVDLLEVAKKVRVMPIRMGVARLYLQQMLKVDQPLPQIYSMDCTDDKSLEHNPSDVYRDIRELGQKAEPVRKAMDLGEMSVPAARSELANLRYRPVSQDNESVRQRLCSQLTEAVGPEDAKALGCIPSSDPMDVINTVCNRIRYSVPSLTPEQFNCPQSSRPV